MIMIDVNSQTFEKFVDYFVWPAMVILIIISCGLIYTSRSILGTTPTSVLLGLGAGALVLSIKAIVDAAKKRKE